jgi:putative heme-binding domain-containing protein
MIDPHARIAEGYATVSLVLDTGKVVAGVVQSEDDQSLVITTPTGEQQRIDQETIEVRSDPLSAMPLFGETLTKRELRDLVEFLSTLR